jgi:acetylglutamate synthase
MKAENEKKSVVKSIKMTPEQELIAIENAKSKGMNFSSYAVDCMIHNNNCITPEVLSIIQEIVNCAERSTKSRGNLIEIENMEREVEKLWTCLK